MDHTKCRNVITTGINKTCVAHFTTILLALCFHTNNIPFDMYTTEMTNFIRERLQMILYYMPAFIHKTVICTAEITEVGILTSHCMSGQAQEAHRNYKKICMLTLFHACFFIPFLMPPHQFTPLLKVLSFSIYTLWLAALLPAENL